MTWMLQSNMINFFKVLHAVDMDRMRIEIDERHEIVKQKNAETSRLKVIASKSQKVHLKHTQSTK